MLLGSSQPGGSKPMGKAPCRLCSKDDGGSYRALVLKGTPQAVAKHHSTIAKHHSAVAKHQLDDDNLYPPY